VATLDAQALTGPALPRPRTTRRVSSEAGYDQRIRRRRLLSTVAARPTANRRLLLMFVHVEIDRIAI
jgi:hypothetical protein